MQIFESHCNTLYGTQAGLQSQFAKQQANEYLQVFSEDLAKFDTLLFFFGNSDSKYVKYLAAAAMKGLLTKNVGKIPPRISPEKLMEFKKYFMEFLT